MIHHVNRSPVEPFTERRSRAMSENRGACFVVDVGAHEVWDHVIYYEQKGKYWYV